MEEKREYVWWAEGYPIYQSNTYASEEEARKAAKEEYEQAAPILDSSCFDVRIDEDNDIEELCPEVLIGVVERINKEDMAHALYRAIVDEADAYVESFGSGCDEVEHEITPNPASDEALKEAISNWIKSASITPHMVAIPMYEYNCKEDIIRKI